MTNKKKIEKGMKKLKGKMKDAESSAVKGKRKLSSEFSSLSKKVKNAAKKG